MEDLLSDFSDRPRIASKRIRAGAAIIDMLIVGIAGLLLGRFFGESYATDKRIGFHLEGGVALAWWLFIICLIPLQEGLTGKTIGKRVAKIKVVAEDYSPCSPGAAIVRHLFDFVDLAVVGLIVAASNGKNQRVGDLVAKTIVIND